jgi:hypothetical protein
MDIDWPVRCFQILGFDVLLDRNLNSFILEVNYPPSVSHPTCADGMKENMIIEALCIVLKKHSNAECQTDRDSE